MARKVVYAIRSQRDGTFVVDGTNQPAIAPMRQVAGPFDTRAEAQEWIDEQ